MARIKRVVTEDLGKIAEKGFCDLIGTEFNSSKPFKYPQERVDVMSKRFASLKQEFEGYRHTGNKDNLNDFTSEDGSKHVSLKTTKKDYKVCPQIIGQPAPSTFCRTFGLAQDATNDQIKVYIETHALQMMPSYIATTFHCPVLFYCEKTNLCQIINMISPIPWSEVTLSFSHQEKKKAWNESSTVYIQRVDQAKTTLGEFQVHNNRPCIKFRFDLKNLTNFFASSFSIRDVPA